ncbi:MAG: alpha/beta hydrolase family protein [Anaerolineae bacterium]
MNEYAPETCHARYIAAAPRTLTFNPSRNLESWRQTLDVQLHALVGPMPEGTPLKVRVEYEREGEGFHETRFVFNAEPGADVPCHLLTPKAGRPPYPVVICLQGHSTGMHISLGRPKHPGDEESIRGDRDFGMQAMREGYAALVLEQRCFGERADRRAGDVHTFNHPCRHAAMVSLLLGRTMVGERVWDVSRAIDALEAFPTVDTTRIGCMGNSGGGTITYYAACLEERIGIAMPSCAVCNYAESIAQIDHCEDNYLPGALNYFEMGDLAGLIAPRSLVVVAGREDLIFPIQGVQEACATVGRIYDAAGAADRFRLVVGEGGHRFYAEQAWPAFRELARW